MSNNGVPFIAPGEIWKIANVSTLAPLAVAPNPTPIGLPVAPNTPTATPPSGVIAAPNTGTGAVSNDADSRVWLPVLVLAAVGIAAIGGAVVTKRR